MIRQADTQVVMKGMQSLPRTFPFGLENMKAELATVYVSGCSRTEAQGVVTTNVKVILRLWRVPGSIVLICSTYESQLCRKA